MEKLIGTVSASSQYVIVKRNNQEKPLIGGDLIYFGDQIITGDKASISIEFVDGGRLDLGRNSSQIIDTEIFDLAFLTVDQSVEDLEAAILRGEDPTAIQEAPAAGEDVIIDGSGFSVVRLEPEEGQQNDRENDQFDNALTNQTTGISTTSAFVPQIVNLLDTTASEATIELVEAIGNEDSGIPLNVTVTLSDNDGSETFAIVVTGVPDDAVLSAGTKNTDGSWSLTSGDLLGLTVVPPTNSDTNFALTFAVTVTEALSGATTTLVTTLNVVVAPVADAPELHIQNITGNEGGVIPIDVRANLTDIDGSESLSITISDVPANFTFSAGTNNDDGRWTFSSAELSGLAIIPPDNFNGEIQLQVTATATEQDLGFLGNLAKLLGFGQPSESIVQTINVQVNPVNDEAEIGGVVTGSVTEESAQSIAGKLTISDVDVGEAVFNATPQGESLAGTFGSLSIDAAGHWIYTVNNAASQVQSLGRGDTATDTITVSALDGSTQQITITINGTNDDAVIGGSLSGSVTEDSSQTVSGVLSIGDVDTDEAVLIPRTDGDAIQGTFGSLSIDAAGHWIYTVNNAASQVQSLGRGDTATDTITVSALDGTTQQITITINGTNDAPIATIDKSEILENNSLTKDVISNDTDIDSGVDFRLLQDSAHIVGQFNLVTGSVTTVGNHVIFDPGTDFDFLTAGQLNVIHIAYTVVDNLGASDTGILQVSILGTDDTPQISGVVRGAAEDITQSVSGKLDITDLDANESTFQPTADGESIAGALGRLTIDAEGNWVYTLNAETQSLNSGVLRTDTILVTTADGTEQPISITITGTNAAADITGVVVGAVTEDTLESISGQLDIVDVDTGEAAFTPTATPITGQFGDLSIDAAGQWRYTLNRAADHVQALNQGDIKTDRFTVTSIDGTAQQIVITIHGTNDQPVATLDKSGALNNRVLVRDVILNDVDVDSEAQLHLHPNSAQFISRSPLDTGSVNTFGDQIIFDPGHDFDFLRVGEVATINIQYVVEDEHGGTNTGTLEIKLIGSETQPTLSSNILVGDAAANRLEGAASDDILLGREGSDELQGGAGSDTLLGGKGHDYLDGGAGSDNLDGGAGNDILVFDHLDLSIVGGEGKDALQLNQGNAQGVVDLHSVSNKISDIEVLKVGGTVNEVDLNIGDILNITDQNNVLFIQGGSGKVTVNLAEAVVDSFQKIEAHNSQASVDGFVEYHALVGSEEISLFVSNDINLETI